MLIFNDGLRKNGEWGRFLWQHAETPAESLSENNENAFLSEVLESNVLTESELAEINTEIEIPLDKQDDFIKKYLSPEKSDSLEDLKTKKRLLNGKIGETWSKIQNKEGKPTRAEKRFVKTFDKIQKRLGKAIAKKEKDENATNVDNADYTSTVAPIEGSFTITGNETGEQIKQIIQRLEDEYGPRKKAIESEKQPYEMSADELAYVKTYISLHNKLVGAYENYYANINNTQNGETAESNNTLSADTQAMDTMFMVTGFENEDQLQKMIYKLENEFGGQKNELQNSKNWEKMSSDEQKFVTTYNNSLQKLNTALKNLQKPDETVEISEEEKQLNAFIKEIEDFDAVPDYSKLPADLKGPANKDKRLAFYEEKAAEFLSIVNKFGTVLDGSFTDYDLNRENMVDLQNNLLTSYNYLDNQSFVDVMAEFQGTPQKSSESVVFNYENAKKFASEYTVDGIVGARTKSALLTLLQSSKEQERFPVNILAENNQDNSAFDDVS